MITHRAWTSILAAWLFCSVISMDMAAQPGSPDGLTYKTGGASMVKLGIDLHKALDPKFQPMVHVKPINIETDVTPFVRLEELTSPDFPAPMATVFISAGFIDLVNNVAHAKAIDKVQKGYFEKYVLSLAQESGEKELKELPNLNDKRFWTFDMMNEQLSNFNQIVGEVVGIKLAHYYLGHYKKYASQLADPQGKVVPINTLLTPDEWDQALKYGVRNALVCGCTTDGIKALYDCIDKMPKRPAWTLYFLPAPEKVKVSKIKKDLTRFENDFFANKELK
jgi:hypothetical protein